MNEILPGLWIGSYPFKEHVPNLLRCGIKSILTLDVAPLSGSVFECFTIKFICLRDEPNQDILNIIEDALEFVEKALENGGVLVHCSMGISRSASIVIAYVMRKNAISYDSALEIVMKERLVYPNIGFVNQLKLFEVMNWKVDTSSPVYTQYASMRRFIGADSIYRKEQHSEKLFVTEISIPATYKCRKCRRGLFSSTNLVSHCIPEKENPTSCIQETESSDISTVLIKGVTLNETRAPCMLNELFTDPLEWTRPYTHEVEGKLYCPGCQTKVGSFNWCGEPCVCGTWVTPAFHFNRRHLDQMKRRPEIAAPSKIEPNTTIPEVTTSKR